jgi:transcriptional regulator with XRE-family HTH domain
MNGAHRLQILRRMEKLQFTAAQVAELVGTSTTTVANYLNQRGRLTGEADLAEKLRRLEKFYDALSPFRLPLDALSLNELAVSAVSAEEVAAFVKRIYPYQE